MRLFLLCLGLLLPIIVSGGERFVVDDDKFIDEAIKSATSLREQGKLVPLEKLRSQLNRKTCRLQLPPPNTTKQEPRELNRFLQKSTVVVATFYHCAECKEWHLDSASGFVAADGVVSTSEHVVDFEDDAVKDGFLVVVDAKARAFPVSEVLASNADSDTCLVRVPGLDLAPLPLSTDAQVGDRVFCLSHPDGNHWMFTSGMVSRFFINREPATDAGQPPAKNKVAPALYLNITAEYSPGSSGAPVVDECGNVVAQVESITSSLEEEKDEKNTSVTTSYGMPLRACVSAEEIAKLVRPAAKRER